MSKDIGTLYLNLIRDEIKYLEKTIQRANDHLEQKKHSIVKFKELVNQLTGKHNGSF